MSMIKVAGTSRTSAVAGAIAGTFRDNKRVEAQAIGAIAVNQVIKALILAKSYLKEDGYDIQVIPEFADVEIDGKTRTAIKFIVEELQSSHSSTANTPIESSASIFSDNSNNSH